MGTYNPIWSEGIEWSFISKILYLIRKGPKTVMVIGLETRAAVAWCRYCVL